MRTLLLVAGPSGSGKSRVARMAGRGVARVNLDDFYHDHDHPGMPRTLGITDWDDVGSWDLDGAIAALKLLVSSGMANVPTYDISRSLRTGWHTVDAHASGVIIAEGIFAPEACVAAREAGLPVEAIWLERRRVGNFSRRLARDLRERRKPPTILVRRGLALYRKEPRLRAQAMAAGFTPVSMHQALVRTRRLAAGNDLP